PGSSTMIDVWNACTHTMHLPNIYAPVDRLNYCLMAAGFHPLGIVPFGTNVSAFGGSALTSSFFTSSLPSSTTFVSVDVIILFINSSVLSLLNVDSLSSSMTTDFNTSSSLLCFII